MLPKHVAITWHCLICIMCFKQNIFCVMWMWSFYRNVQMLFLFLLIEIFIVLLSFFILCYFVNFTFSNSVVWRCCLLKNLSWYCYHIWNWRNLSVLHLSGNIQTSLSDGWSRSQISVLLVYIRIALKEKGLKILKHNFIHPVKICF
jgi:hypothetical protein